MNYLSFAIYALRPNSEFTFTNEDYSTIQWIKLEGKAPTQAEIDVAIETIKAKEISDKAAAESAKQIAQGKLTALGLTVEDLKALGL